MKVLMINGSPHKDGNTAQALKEMQNVFEKEGIEASILHIGQMPIRSCIACGRCGQLNKCVFEDAVNEAARLFEEADGLVAASPVYYAAANPTLSAFMTRLFYSTGFDKRMKVGAAVVAARRGGASAAF
ncbi:MAG: flavodoxin family protein, partial [Clostridia bacterium]|nr:flavodoxin family protein [Clostridia bacterium]